MHDISSTFYVEVWEYNIILLSFHKVFKISYIHYNENLNVTHLWLANVLSHVNYLKITHKLLLDRKRNYILINTRTISKLPGSSDLYKLNHTVFVYTESHSMKKLSIEISLSEIIQNTLVCSTFVPEISQRK